MGGLDKKKSGKVSGTKKGGNETEEKQGSALFLLSSTTEDFE